MKRDRLILPFLFLVFLCGCGSQKDVPEAMPPVFLRRTIRRH